MRKNWKHIPLLGLFMASPLIASAQEEIIGEAAINPFVENGPGFFIAIVAGVLLAIGFQALLTTLSVASGISAIGNIQKKAHKSSNNKDKNSHSSDSTPVIKKVSSAFGVWTMITVSISLFFASLLAVKLSFVGANFVGLTLGLVIWAAFFTTVLYLEMKTVSSLIGGLFSIVMSGFRQSASILSGVGSMFSSSEESKAKSVAKVSAHENARAMRKELRKLFNRNDLDKKIDDYVTRLSPQDLDVKRIKKELKDLLTDIEVKEKAELGENGVTRRMFLETVSSSPNVSKEDVKKLSGMFDEVKGIAKSDGQRTDKAEMAIERFTPASQEDIENFKNKVSEYLKGTHKDELQPEKMRKDLEAIMKDPKKAKGIFQNKASQVDHDTIVNILSQRKDINREDAEKYAGYAEKALNYLKDHLGSGSSNGQSSNSGQSQSGYAETEVEHYQTADIRITKSGASTDTSSKGSNAKKRIAEYISSLQDKKDYNLDMIKNEFTSIFSSSDDDHEGLTYKLKHYNKEEMSQFLKKNTSIPNDKADMIAAKAVEARDTVITKADEVEREVNMRLHQAKEETLKQAENTREAAASAAWWLVATAVISGVASAIGGMMALESWF